MELNSQAKSSVATYSQSGNEFQADEPA